MMDEEKIISPLTRPEWFADDIKTPAWETFKKALEEHIVMLKENGQ